MKKLILLSVISGFAILQACKKEPSSSSRSKVSPDLPETTFRYYTSANADPNKANEKATLGRVLFYERALSVSNNISCASCHKQANGFADNEAFSHGFENKLTTRNSMPIQNLLSGQKSIPDSMRSSFTTEPDILLFWDGRVDNVFGIVSNPIRNHIEMGISDPNTLADKIAQLPYYKDLFMDAYGDEQMSFARINEAITFFICAIKTTNTRFDEYQRTKTGMSAVEERGFELFVNKYNCTNCHNLNHSPFYSKFSFMDIGLADISSDKGLGGRTGIADDMHRFKVPQLRNIALTAPYMHDGRFKTLKDVLNHYSRNINNSPNLDERLKMNGAPMRMNISEDEQDAIVAFLGTLTDYEVTTGSQFSDPFKIK